MARDLGAVSSIILGVRVVPSMVYCWSPCFKKQHCRHPVLQLKLVIFFNISVASDMKNVRVVCKHCYVFSPFSMLILLIYTCLYTYVKEDVCTASTVTTVTVNHKHQISLVVLYLVLGCDTCVPENKNMHCIIFISVINN